jgi:hypothetical protein
LRQRPESQPPTSGLYGQGESPEIVGKALAGGRRDDVVLATKVFSPMGDDINRRGMSRRCIMRAVEDSLRRLDTDWIDIYQIHRLDPATDIEQTLAAFTDLVQQGKVRYRYSAPNNGARADAPTLVVDCGRGRYAAALARFQGISDSLLSTAPASATRALQQRGVSGAGRRSSVARFSGAAKRSLTALTEATGSIGDAARESAIDVR